MSVSRQRKKGLLSTDCEGANFLLMTYATDPDIPLADQSGSKLKQTASITPTVYGQVLLAKTFHCGSF